MAQQMTYTVGVEADISKLKAQLNEAFESLSKIGNSQQITMSLQKASSSALELANNLSRAINQDTGKLDLSVFNDNLKRSGQTLDSYYSQLVQLGPAGQEAFLKVASAVVQAEQPIRRTNKLLDSLWVAMKNTMRWQLTSSALHGFTGALQQAYGYAKSLDSSLNNIRIVSGKSADEMARFAEQANKAAKTLSTTTTNYTDASLIYYQQGLTDQEVLDRTETTIKMANVAGTTAEAASQQLTAIWNNFYEEGGPALEYYADVIVALGVATASSSDEISEGLEKFAAVADTVGLSYEYATAALATVTAQTRESASVVGTAFRTLFSRIQGLQQGETLDDGTTLNKYSQALANVGVNIKDSNGDLKQMDTILDELGGKWNTLAQDQKIALAETVAGVRQWTHLVALMDNWDVFKDNLTIAKGSSGSLEKQAEIYAESWEAARDRTKAAAEDIYDSLINPDFFIDLDDVFTPFLSGIAQVIDSIGGLRGVALVAATAMSSLYGDKMAAGVRDIVHNISVATGYEQIKNRLLQQEAASLTDEIAGMDAKYQLESQMMDLRQQANTEMDYLNTHQKELLQADIDDLEVLRQKTNELLKQKENVESRVKDRVNAVSLGIGAGAADLTAQTTTNKHDSRYASKVFSKYQSDGKEITQQQTAVAALAQEYKKVAEEVSRVNIIMSALEKNNGDLEKTRKDVRAMGSEFETTADKVNFFNTELSQTTLLNKLEKMADSLNAKLVLLHNEIEARGGNAGFLEDLGFDLLDLQKKAAAAGMSMEEFSEKMAALSTALEDQTYRVKNFADKFVYVGQTLSQGLMVVQSFINLGRIFNDEDMTAGERLIGIFTSLSMVIPLVGNIINQINKAMKEQGVITAVVEALQKKQNTTESHNVVTKLAVWIATRKQAAASGEHTVALEGEALAQKSVKAGLLAYLGVALIAAAAVAALGLAIYALVKVYNKEADAAKHAAEAAEETREAAEDAQTAADNLRSSIEAYDSAVDKLEECARGTKEWRDALKEVNAAAIEVLNNTGKLSAEDLQNLRNSDGTLNKDALENLQNKADQRATDFSYAASIADIYAADANLRSEAKSLGRQMTHKSAGDNEKTEILLSNLEDLSNLTDKEFLAKLQELGFTVTSTSTRIKQWKATIDEMADTASSASSKFELITQMAVSEELGPAESTRDQAIQDIVSDNIDALAQDLTEEWKSKITGSSISRTSNSNNAIYQETLKALQDARYDVSVQTSNAVRGTSNNRSLAFLNSSGEEVVYNSEQIASMIAASQALGEISEKSEAARTALQGLDEDALSYIANGDLSGATREALSKLRLTEDIKNAFGGDDAVKNIIAAQKDIGFEEVTDTMVKEFIQGVQHAAINAKADFEDVGKGMAHSVQNALEEEVDTKKVSLDEYQNIADIFNLAAAYGKLDEAIAAYRAGTLENFAAGIEEVVNSLDSFATQYANIHKVIDGIKTGDTISEENYETLGAAAQKYFTYMLDGTYRLVGNAEQLRKEMQQNQINEAQIQRKLQQDDNVNLKEVQGYDFDGLSSTQLFSDGYSFNEDRVQQQINIIRALGDQSAETKEKIQAWQEQLDEHKFDNASETLAEIANAVAECDTSVEHINETLFSGEAAENAWELAIANSYSSIEELREAYEAHTISLWAFNEAALNLDSILDTQNLDVDEWEEYADYLEKTVDGLKGNDKAARIVAKSIMKMNDGIEDLSANFEDWNDVLKNSNKASEEYKDAIEGTRNALSNLLDTSQDYITDDFINEHLEEIQQAANGDAEAIDNLRADLAEGIILNIEDVDSLQNLPEGVLNKWQSLQDYLANTSFTLGEIDDQDFIDSLNELIEMTGMDVDQVNALCDALGFEAAYEKDDIQYESKIPTTTTEHKRVNMHYDENGNLDGWTDIEYPTKTDYVSNDNGEYSAFAVDVAADGSVPKPKITGLTKKVNGNLGNRSSTKSSGGGGSSSKSSTKEKKKTTKDVEDRYHNINRQLERQGDLLKDINTATDRAYGRNKLSKFQEGIKALEKEQELLNTKFLAAQDYLAQDSATVKSYFSEAQIDSNGEITNYEELLRLNMELYNVEVDKYNLAMENKELTDEETTALKTQLEDAKTAFDDRQSALKQYESTLDAIRDTTDDIQENAQSIADLKLKEITYKVELALDVKKIKDQARELSKTIAESFSDSLTHGLESFNLSTEAAKAEQELYNTYKEELESLEELYNEASSEADRAKIISEMESLQSNVISSAKALINWAESIEDIVPDAVKDAAERFAVFTDQLEHNTTILDTIKELYTLQGVTYKTSKGFNILQKNAQNKLDAQVASAKMQKSWYLEAEAKLQEAQAQLDSLNGDEHDYRYDAYKKARDAFLEEFNEAQEAYLSSAQEAMETAQDMYLQQIERATYEFGQAVSNGIGLDLLQDKYDHYIDESKRYFDQVEEAYQVASWYNKLQKDIDDETNTARQQKLKALQEEIDQRKEGNKLSQYDLDILNAKYQLLQAEMALEDAQNNKSKLQLVRDSQGNWNYQYTADQDAIANAQQKVLDAQNEWYSVAKTQVTDVTGEIVSSWKECSDKIKEVYSDMTLTDQQRAQQAEEIYQYYTEKIKYLEEEKQNAISDMNEAGKEVVNDFENNYAEALDSMTSNSEDFQKALEEYLEQAQNNFDDYQDKVNEVADETSTMMKDLAETTDQVTESTDKLAESGYEASQILWDQVDAASDLMDQQLDLAEAVWETVYAYQALANAIADSVDAKSNSLDEQNYDPNTDYKALLEQGLSHGYIEYGDELFEALYTQRGNKIAADKTINAVNNRALFKNIGVGDEISEKAQEEYNTEDLWNAAIRKLQEKYGLATGGYTGLFDDAKLAFLHQKELVLNQTDTENILAAVQTVRSIGSDLFKSIEKSLDNSAIAAMALMNQKLSPITANPADSSLEQTIHIDKIEFPNVTSRTEIEEAFISLTNDAAQWAKRKI